MNKKFFFLILFSLSLTSCNDALTNAVKGNRYISSNWMNNYFSNKERSFESASVRNEYKLSSSDKVFTSFADPNFIAIDKEGSSRNLYLESGENSYSNYAKLSICNESVKDGVISKLFDGIMSCGGRYESVRTQIKGEGFNYKFNTILKNNTYFAMHFKSDNNFKQEIIPQHNSSFDLNIDFYYLSNNEYTYDRYIYQFINFKSNSNMYSFFGFPIKDCSNLIGFGISYSNLVDEFDKNYAHALLIYEVLLPYSIW